VVAIGVAWNLRRRNEAPMAWAEEGDEA
jgi:hypothetical protein